MKKTFLMRKKLTVIHNVLQACKKGTTPSFSASCNACVMPIRLLLACIGLSRLVQACLGLTRLVKAYKGLFRLVHVCPGLPKLAQACSGLSRLDPKVGDTDKKTCSAAEKCEVLCFFNCDSFDVDYCTKQCHLAAISLLFIVISIHHKNQQLFTYHPQLSLVVFYEALIFCFLLNLANKFFGTYLGPKVP